MTFHNESNQKTTQTLEHKGNNCQWMETKKYQHTG